MKRITLITLILLFSLSCKKETCKTCVTTTGYLNGVVTYKSTVRCGDDLKQIKVGEGSWVYTDTTMVNITCY